MAFVVINKAEIIPLIITAMKGVLKSRLTLPKSLGIISSLERAYAFLLAAISPAFIEVKVAKIAAIIINGDKGPLMSNKIVS